MTSGLRRVVAEVLVAVIDVMGSYLTYW
jgi:hypothetical protein